MPKKNESRRKLLKSVAAGSGALMAGKNLPESWRKPVVDSVLIPAHAQSSPPTGTTPAPCSGDCSVNSVDTDFDAAIPTVTVFGEFCSSPTVTLDGASATILASDASFITINATGNTGLGTHTIDIDCGCTCSTTYEGCCDITSTDYDGNAAIPTVTVFGSFCASPSVTLNGTNATIMAASTSFITVEAGNSVTPGFNDVEVDCGCVCSDTFEVG